MSLWTPGTWTWGRGLRPRFWRSPRGRSRPQRRRSRAHPQMRTYVTTSNTKSKTHLYSLGWYQNCKYLASDSLVDSPLWLRVVDMLQYLLMMVLFVWRNASTPWWLVHFQCSISVVGDPLKNVNRGVHEVSYLMCACELYTDSPPPPQLPRERSGPAVGQGHPPPGPHSLPVAPAGARHGCHGELQPRWSQGARVLVRRRDQQEEGDPDGAWDPR